jgi:integrase/recombinase XerD
MYNKSQVTVEGMLWTYSKTKEGLHPVKIKVTYRRNTTYYSVQLEGTNVYADQQLWDAITSPAPKGKAKKIREAIEDLKSKARETIQTLTFRGQPFSLNRFKQLFEHGSGSSSSFFSHFHQYIAELTKERRMGTASAYGSALQCFKKFRKGKDIDPVDITVQLLKDFDNFIRSPKVETTSRGKTTIRMGNATTVAMYMRAMRAVFNFIIGQQPWLAEVYPFARGSNERQKYQIQKGSGSKGRALSLAELQNLVSMETMEGSPERRAKLLWLFSFYCQGMNFKDIAKLKFRNIENDRIVYVRAKTSRTERKQEHIEVAVSKQISAIISELAGVGQPIDGYVFSILPPHTEESDVRRIVNQKLKVVNDWLGKLCTRNGLPKVTTYWARHTYASLLKESGVSVDMIRELLGHSDAKTTEAYLKRFDLEKKKQINQRISSMLNTTE